MQETFSMRKKEGLADYRYFPEPDLPPLVTDSDFVDSVRQTMAELPSELRQRLTDAGLPIDVVLIIAQDVQARAAPFCCADASDVAHSAGQSVVSATVCNSVRSAPFAHTALGGMALVACRQSMHTLIACVCGAGGALLSRRSRRGCRRKASRQLDPARHHRLVQGQQRAPSLC